MRRYLLKLLIPAVAGLVVTYALVVELSAIAVALAKALLGVALLYSVVKYAHDEIDAIHMYKEYPLTYAAMLVAYALVIAASLVGS